MMIPADIVQNGVDGQLRTALLQWNRGTCRQWDLLDVLRFAAPRFMHLVEFIAQMELVLGQEPAVIYDQKAWDEQRRYIERAISSCEELGLLGSAHTLRRLLVIFRPDADVWPREQRELFSTARAFIESELEHREFLMLAPEQARFYKSPDPKFGADVSAKFPRAAEDIENARDCLALEQGTACVFHLMRVMEMAVQQFARRLKVSVNPDRDTWNQILDAVNGQLRQMPRKTTRQVTRHSEYATAAAHLNAVRIAWRNEVMHPKQTYTLEEATQVFNNVETFMRDLAQMI